MQRSESDFTYSLSAGAASGMAGTAVMMAARSFDHEYAPATMAGTRQVPGSFVVHAAQHAIGFPSLPQPLEQVAELAVHASYGTMFGVLYGLWRGRNRSRSALADGIVLGAAVYAAGYAGLLPVLRLSRPIWKERFSIVTGELLRHVIYGVATSAVYGVVDRQFNRSGSTTEPEIRSIGKNNRLASGPAQSYQ